MKSIHRIKTYVDQLVARGYARKLYWQKKKKLTPGLESIELSKREIASLEISVQVGCALYCDYCPQDIYRWRFKEIFPNQDKKLSEQTFYSAMSNVPTSTLIKWTGFAEPLASPDFHKFVLYLNKTGYEQDIGTTLSGSTSSMQWFSENLELFNNITIHLPDDNKLMKCNVNANYLETLKSVLAEQKRLGLKNDRFVIFLIGDNFQQDVENVINLSRKTGSIDSVQVHKAEVLNTRNANINVRKLNIKKISERKSLKIRIDQKKVKKYYCSYRRLNQGVMLPNGKVALCCQDYNLDFIIGDLKTDNLDILYQRIESDSKLLNDFKSGHFSPCNKCEHYTSTETPFSGYLRK